MGQHGKHRALVIFLGRLWLAVAALAAGPDAAAAQDCRLALLLAMDVSSSVDAREDRLQRGGMAAALVAPEVREAFFASGPAVALAIYEWSGRFNHRLLLDWTLIDSDAALDRASRVIAESRRADTEFPTALGNALGYGAGLLRKAPDCLAKTLDMAGDGQNNDGFPPALAYAQFPFDGITVNGLVIKQGDPRAGAALADFYRREVLHGEAAFLEEADGFEDYERAMRRKLERELSAPVVGRSTLPAQERRG
ncbi:DUF1194 domain-containing protein [Sulfitobacter sp. LCG007]